MSSSPSPEGKHGNEKITYFPNEAWNIRKRPGLRAKQTGQISQTEPQYVLRKLLVLYANLSLKVMVRLSILTVYACLLLCRCLKRVGVKRLF